ncbi:hypothetical protein Tco_1292736 [Tanacetum coccineum]
MDDLNITMEEYIRLEEERARRQGRTFNWQIAKYGKMECYEDEDDSFTDLETEYPAIVFYDASDAAFSYSENENDKVNMPPSLSPEPTFGYIDDLDFFKDFENEFPAIAYNDLKSKSDPLIEPSVGDGVTGEDDGEALFTSHVWRRLFEVRAPLVREFLLEFFSTCRMSDIEMGLDVADTLCFQLGGARRRMTWRLFILALGLHSEEEMAEAGFGADWSGSKRVILDKGDLRDYWMEISSNRDFLGLAPSYVHIKDHVRRLCHRMIACSISGRGQEAEKYLFRHAEGRKSGSRLSGGHFIRHLAAHFGLVGDQGLRGLSVVVSELPVINLHELARLNIYSRFGDTWAWVDSGPERQQAAAAGAPGAAEDAPAADEGA